jgi:hypothetical protein
MAKNTLSAFIAASNINASLIRAVIRQIGGFEEFKNRADDICNYGANSGFSGFIYYSDTVPFAKRQKANIMEYAAEMADSLGESLIKMIAGFNCLKITEAECAEAIYNPKSENRTQVFNALAWFALEEVCRAWVDFQYEQRN